MFIEELHVLLHRRGWAVRRTGARKAISVHPSRAEAVSKARRIATHEGIHLVVHDERGEVVSDELCGQARSSGVLGTVLPTDGQQVGTSKQPSLT